MSSFQKFFLQRKLQAHITQILLQPGAQNNITRRGFSSYLSKRFIKLKGIKWNPFGSRLAQTGSLKLGLFAFFSSDFPDSWPSEAKCWKADVWLAPESVGVMIPLGNSGELKPLLSPNYSSRVADGPKVGDGRCISVSAGAYLQPRVTGRGLEINVSWKMQQ